MYDKFYYKFDIEEAKQRARNEARTEYAWILHEDVNYENFDLHYVPNRFEKTQIHTWGSHNNQQSHTTWLIPVSSEPSGVNYHTQVLPSNKKIKQIQADSQGIDTIRKQHANEAWVWIVDPRVDYTNFNFDWLPASWDNDKTHYFSMLNCEKLSYTKLVNTRAIGLQTKFHETSLKFKDPIKRITADRLTDKDLPEWVWVIDERIDYTNFDFTWLPDAWDLDKTHCFTMRGCEELSYTKLINTKYKSKINKYHIANLVFKDPIKQITIDHLTDKDLPEWVWVIDERIDYTNFDFTWLPDAWDISKVHCFTMKDKEQLSYTKLVNTRYKAGSEKYHISNLDFISPIAKLEWPTNISLTELPNWIANQELKNEWIWVCDNRIDYTNFDFSWLPDAWDYDYIHCFTMRGHEQLSYTWLANKSALANGEFKFWSSSLEFAKPANRIHWPADINYSSLGKWVNEQTFENEWTWICDPRIDYTNFDFSWFPDAWEYEYKHCFTMRNKQQLSYTWLVNSKSAKTDKFKFHESSLEFNESIPQLQWPNGIPDVKWLEQQDINSEYVWLIDNRINYENFDFSWLPDAWEQNYAHCFCMAGKEQLSYTWLVNFRELKKKIEKFKFHASDLKFAYPVKCIEWPDIPIGELSNWARKQKITDWTWILDPRINYFGFDFDWLPEAWDVNYTHCFSLKNQTQLSYTWLVSPSSINTNKFKFHNSNLHFTNPVQLLEWPNFSMINIENDWYSTLHKWISYQSYDEWLWIIDSRIDYTNFDFDWLPDLQDHRYIHCFTNKNKDQLGYTWLVNKGSFKDKNYKFHSTHLEFYTNPAIRYWGNFSTIDINKDDWYDCLLDSITDIKEEYIWICDKRIDYTNFDFTWLPDRDGHAYTHVFTNRDKKQLGYTWLVNVESLKTRKFKFHQSNLTFSKSPTIRYWDNFSTVDLTKDDWYDCLLDTITNIDDEYIWICDKRIDYTNFDFTWIPDRDGHAYTHVFTNRDQRQLGYTWLVNVESLKTRKFKFHTAEFTFDVDKIYWPNFADTSLTGADWYESLANWVEQQSITNEWLWICDERIDYTNFDFTWMPDRDGHPYIHCFTNKGQGQLSYTWLVNVESIKRRKYKFYTFNLTFSKPIERLNWPKFTTTFLSGDDWYDSLANWILDQSIRQEWVWVCDDRIDYGDFDFDWLPDRDGHEYIHCFTMKDKQQLSYTWLVNVQSLRKKQFKFWESNLEFNKRDEELILLDMGLTTEQYKFDKKIRYTGVMLDVLQNAIKKTTAEWLRVISNTCNYQNYNFDWIPDLDQIDQTHCWPTVKQKKGETFLIHVPSYLRMGEFKFNFEHFAVYRKPWPGIVYSEDNLADGIKNNSKTGSLYSIYYKSDSIFNKIPEPCLWEKRPVVGMSPCNSISLVPRDCVIKKEIYEYPYLEKQQDCGKPRDIDVVFIHNGERDSGINLSHCNTMLSSTGMKLKVSSGVNGRLKAYQAAAELSDTDWFLAVFAKCHVTDIFYNFNWRPDYWQQAKHYIFYNHNKDLDLTYGHMAPIAYNKRLMLENTGGLDMTLAQEHAVVPIVLSETQLTDPWDIWRTAFRETVKLMYYSKDTNNLELEYRLDKWLSAEQHWYKAGAQDAKDYFESVNGEWAWIMITNEWDWLRKRFDTLYSTVQT